jgi:hypothetical protein
MSSSWVDYVWLTEQEDAMRRDRIGRIVGLIALVVVLVSSGCCWWFLWKSKNDFEAFQSRVGLWGGHVSRSLNFNSPLMRFRGNGPSIIDPLLGTDGFHISIHGQDVTREQLSELVSVSPIRSLSIAATSQFSDDQVIGINDPGAIRGLHLNDVNVTDRSLETIARMGNLSELSLVGTAISDATVDRVIKLKNINNVYVGSPNIRSIRLIEAKIVDESGMPAVVAGGSLSVRGRIAIEGGFGKPGNIRVMVRSDGDQPPWQSHPYGWNSSRGSIGSLIEKAPGIWVFDLSVSGISAGKSIVEIWIDQASTVGPNFVHYRLTPLTIDLADPGSLDRKSIPPK